MPIILIGKCVPYSGQACIDAGKKSGLITYGGANFAGDWSTKGCYSYKYGKYAGTYWYGTGGDAPERKASLDHVDSVYRPYEFDCVVHGLFFKRLPTTLKPISLFPMNHSLSILSNSSISNAFFNLRNKDGF